MLFLFTQFRLNVHFVIFVFVTGNLVTMLSMNINVTILTVAFSLVKTVVIYLLLKEFN